MNNHPSTANATLTIRPLRTLPAARRRGVTAVLSMMFLVIFGSLAAAMAIVSQGNLRTADSHVKINRSLAAAETGMDLMGFRLNQITKGDADSGFPGIFTRAGLIFDGTEADPTDSPAYELWLDLSQELVAALQGEENFSADTGDPFLDFTSLPPHAIGSVPMVVIPEVSLGPGEPSFTATLMPHPLPLSEQPSTLGYDDPFYDRAPYDGSDPSTGIDWDVSEAAPLDGRFIRVQVTGVDGNTTSKNRVTRSITKDFLLIKTIPYAVLSRSRVMIGRNVQIDGNVGSLFDETNIENGHPIQIQSDFLGLSDALDAVLSPPNADFPAGGTFHNELVVNDINGDNRINVQNPTETQSWPGGQAGAEQDDIDGDGFVSEFDYFLELFDNETVDSRVSLNEFIDTVNNGQQQTAAQLFQLLDQRSGTTPFDQPDGFIDTEDLYSKIRGSVSISASTDDWNLGLADWANTGATAEPAYQDFLQGQISPDFGEAPFMAEDPALNIHSFDQHSFDTRSFADLAVNTLTPTSGVQFGNEPAAYFPPGTAHPGADSPLEEVPFGAAFPYDFFERPVHINKVFNNLMIPVGTNALFINCKFEGVTFIEVISDNGDENFNYIGMQESDGSNRHPDFDAQVNGATVDTSPGANGQRGTKAFGNNIRFDRCTFEGPLVSGSTSGDPALETQQPDQYTHTRNKVTFTGETTFDFDAETDDELRELFQRSSLLLPNMSVEMGTHFNPDDPEASTFNTLEPLELSGAIVAGLIDIRGAVTINGTLITTYRPISGVAPVRGSTAPQFNTTLGYFAQDSGDLEAGGFLPETGLGMVRLTYDPTLALPDGILGPIQLKPIETTYSEGR